MTINPTMNLIMYGFQGVTGASAISRRVVAETRPSMYTRQKVVGAIGEIILNRFQFTLVEKNECERPELVGKVKSYASRALTSVVAFGSAGLSGCLIVVFQYL